MAKQKDQPFSELLPDAPARPDTRTFAGSEAANAANAANAPAVDENAALKERIAELEQQLAAKPVAGEPAKMDPNNPNFVVGCLPDLNPTHRVSVKDATKGILVHASDGPNAERRYREKTGMIRTEHPYEIETL